MRPAGAPAACERRDGRQRGSVDRAVPASQYLDVGGRPSCYAEAQKAMPRHCASTPRGSYCFGAANRAKRKSCGATASVAAKAETGAASAIPMAAAAKHIILMVRHSRKPFPCRNHDKGGGRRLNMIGLAVPLVDLANFAAAGGATFVAVNLAFSFTHAKVAGTKGNHRRWTPSSASCRTISRRRACRPRGQVVFRARAGQSVIVQGGSVKLVA